MEVSSEHHARNLLQKLNEQRLSSNRDQYCDVIFTTPQSFPPHSAHISVLATCSKFFQAIWKKNREESLKDEKENGTKINNPTNETKNFRQKMMSISLPGITSEQLEHILNYVYTGKTVVKENNVKSILVASTLLQVDGLRNVCCKYIRKTVRKINRNDSKIPKASCHGEKLKPQTTWSENKEVSMTQIEERHATAHTSNVKDRIDGNLAPSHGISEFTNQKNRISDESPINMANKTRQPLRSVKTNNALEEKSRSNHDVISPRGLKRPLLNNPQVLSELVRQRCENHHSIRYGNNPSDNVNSLINFHHLCENASPHHPNYDETDKHIPIKRRRSNDMKTSSFVTEQYNPQMGNIAPGIFVNNYSDHMPLKEAIPRYGIPAENLFYEQQRLLALRLNWPAYMAPKSINDIRSHVPYLVDTRALYPASPTSFIRAGLEPTPKPKQNSTESPKIHGHVRKMKLLSSLNYDKYSPKPSPIQDVYDRSYASKFEACGDESDDSGRPCST